LNEEIAPQRSRHRGERAVPEESGLTVPAGIFCQSEDTEAQKYAEAATLFNTGQYFESHERLEELWLIADPEDREIYHGLVQVSVALLHAERGNHHGAWTLFRRAIRHWQQGHAFEDQTVNRLQAEVEQALTAIFFPCEENPRSRDGRPQMPLTMFWKKPRDGGALRSSEDFGAKALTPQRD